MIGPRAAILEELKEISAGEKRLMDALFVGGVTAESIKARIEEAHERRAVLECELARSAEAVDISGGAEKLRRYAADLRGLVGKHVVQARQTSPGSPGRPAPGVRAL
jgi:malonyl CoA-acyl carrier protein transacylase